MEANNLTEGLFLKNYLGTISAHSRPRTEFQAETRSAYVHPLAEDLKYNICEVDDGVVSNSRILHNILLNNNESSRYTNKRQQNGISSKVPNTQNDFVSELRSHNENDDEKEKKKERKWTLGGLFRRKLKKDADDSSEDSEDDGKKGFLSRRKSKSERRKLKSKNTANGFDVVIPQVKEPVPVNGIESITEQLWGTNSMGTSPKTTGHGHINGQTRFIHRNHGIIPVSETSKTNKDCLQVPKINRRESNHSRSSGGSENMEIRKGRKEMMARAEAKRDMICDGSSSDEYESYHSNSSLNKLNSDASGFRRPRRPDRHNKRLSRDDDVLIHQRENERIIKSDFEGNRSLPSNCRWISKNYYLGSSDHEATRINLMNHSRTSSPSRSPRAQKKQLHQYMSSIQNTYHPTSTFPPGTHHIQQPKSVPLLPVAMPPNPRQIHTKERPLHGSQTIVGLPHRSQHLRHNPSLEMSHNLPRSISASGNLTDPKMPFDYDRYLYSRENAKEKSLSVDQDICSPFYFDNKASECLQQNSMQKHNLDEMPFDFRCKYPASKTTHEKLDMRALGDLNRSEMNNLGEQKNCFKSCKNEANENRTASTPSPSIQSGISPQQPAYEVQRSASGNSFSNFYQHSNTFTPNRSNSYQHIPSFASRNMSNSDLYRIKDGWFENPNHNLSLSKKEGKLFFWPPVKTNTAKSFAGTNASNCSTPKNCSIINAPVNYSSKESSQGTFDSNNALYPSNGHGGNNFSILRYYADQNPRSRNPIHITCNPAVNPENVPLSEPYLKTSDGSPPTKNVSMSASEFWKKRDQEVMSKCSQSPQKSENFLKPPINHTSVKSDGPRSSSPRARDQSMKIPADQNVDVGQIRSQNLMPLANVENKSLNGSNKKSLKEEFNASKVMSNPPEPPVRRLSKQDVLLRLHKCEQLQNEGVEVNKDAVVIENGNLDDALNELEVIYNSLRLKDEDLVDRAERRDLPTFCYSSNVKVPESTSASDGNQHLNAEIDLLQYTSSDSKSPSDVTPSISSHQRAVPHRRSGVPDKVCDDMAFRRLNTKDKSDAKKFPSPSYLRYSPALSPLPGAGPYPKRESPVAEPDITYDDVVFRNLRHANSTLKIQDPQPPFGIPIGVITPAANSDYLHATPQKRFRPTFTSSKTPDIVKDDLAFRNLRKDNKRVSGDSNSEKSDSTSLLKKRAVRSLSANVYNIMRKENSNRLPQVRNNTEKSQSLTDLTNKCFSGNGNENLEKRLKELKDEKNAKKAEFFEMSKELRKKTLEGKCLSWTELANLNDNFQNVTDESKKSLEQKCFRSPVVELSRYPAAAPLSTLQGNPFKESTNSSSVDEEQLEHLLSALAKEARNTSKDLERQLDELNVGNVDISSPSESVLSSKDELKAKAIDDFNKKFKFDHCEKNKRRRNLSLCSLTETKEEIRRSNSLERKHAKKSFVERENSLQLIDLPPKNVKNKRSDVYEDKKKEVSCVLSDTIGQIMKDVNSVSEVSLNSGSKTQLPNSKETEGKLLENANSSASLLSSYANKGERLAADVATDLSQILYDVQVEQQLNNEISKDAKEDGEVCANADIFQEVYEYNCLPKDLNMNRKKSKEFKVAVASTEMVAPEFECKISGTISLCDATKEEEELIADVEQEFEKLHDEVNSNGKNVKECSQMARANDNLVLVDDLIADITNTVERSTNDSHSQSSFPFPKEECGLPSSSNERRQLNKNECPAGSSKGEGEVKKTSMQLDSNVWLACSYALALAFHLQEIDCMTALGIILAVVSIIGILIL